MSLPHMFFYPISHGPAMTWPRSYSFTYWPWVQKYLYTSFWSSLTECSVSNLMATKSVYCTDSLQPDSYHPLVVVQPQGWQHALADGKEPDPPETAHCWLLWTTEILTVRPLKRKPWNPASHYWHGWDFFQLIPRSTFHLHAPLRYVLFLF